MSLFLSDDERTQNFKELFKEYLDDPNPNDLSLLTSYKDIALKAGLEVIVRQIQEMCVQAYISPPPQSPSAKYTAFGSNWIKIFQNLIIDMVKDEGTRITFTNQILAILKGQDQNMTELASIILDTPIFYFSRQIQDELLEAYNKAIGSGKKLALSFAIMKIRLEPEYFEEGLFPRLPPEISKADIEQEYLKLANVGSDLRMAKIAVLDHLLSSFLKQIIILDIGFHGLSWKEVWSDWKREKEV